MIKNINRFMIIILMLILSWESSNAQIINVLGNSYIRDFSDRQRSDMWFELVGGKAKENNILPHEIMVVHTRSGNLTTNLLTGLGISGVERIEVKIPFLIFKIIINQDIDDFVDLFIKYL